MTTLLVDVLVQSDGHPPPSKFSPSTLQLLFGIFSHVANPSASEVSTFPEAGEPPVILTCPLTSRVASGSVTPIPTFPISVKVNRSPRTCHQRK